MATVAAVVVVVYREQAVPSELLHLIPSLSLLLAFQRRVMAVRLVDDVAQETGVGFGGRAGRSVTIIRSAWSHSHCALDYSV